MLGCFCMLKIDAAFLIAVLFIGSGCGSSPVVVPDPATEPVAAPVPAAITAPDPVATLKQMLENCPKKKAWVKVSLDKTGWDYWQLEIKPIGFDVKKTDSLVSPLIGLITIVQELSLDGPYASAEEAVQPKSRVDYDPTRTLLTGIYAWQSDKWEFQALERTLMSSDGSSGKIKRFKPEDLKTEKFCIAWPFVQQIPVEEKLEVPPR